MQTSVELKRNCNHDLHVTRSVAEILHLEDLVKGCLHDLALNIILNNNNTCLTVDYLKPINAWLWLTLVLFTRK